MFDTYTKPTLKEAKATAKRLGYQLRKTDGEFEVYPTGNRDAAYFTDCIVDALQTARTDAAQRFAVAVRNVAHPGLTQEQRQALIEWHAKHGANWKQALLDAWYRGAYGHLPHPNTSAHLQRLRNTCGHEVLHLFI